ncbi:MAG: deoxyribodipyrimidine photolyase [Pelagibacteraceae bacterium]|nr:deoxyribodipyrimidine photolyase [Pelagibacteraceae bacterium]|tara:strand:- start:12609 stop:14027 length:1419 start_codon:yes stop_codon:yes gene_type:complete
MLKKNAIIWFRNDLRIKDNLALSNIIKDYEKITAIYIIDPKIKIGKASKWWLHESLKNLNNSLNKLNSHLNLFYGSPYKILNSIIKKEKVCCVYWNRLYDEYSISRDNKIKKNLINLNIEVKTYNSYLIFDPWIIKNNSGSFFKVFTPFWNKCLENIKINQLTTYPKKFLHNIKINDFDKELKKLNIKTNNSIRINNLKKIWLPSESESNKLLDVFIKNKINNYSFGRDRPDKDLTSRLSPYLHFGQISAQRIYNKIYSLKSLSIVDKKKYIAEIGWREFSYNLFYNYPDIKNISIRKKFNKFPWIKNNKHLNLWKCGITGIPIVDAGMRQLLATGWIHNRVRMIVGSFLCKNLLINWREGEKWFYENLVDADEASNSAGWQWIAGCGADAAPYFRIFNPVLQGQKFDPDGKYVKKYIKELKNIPKEMIHSPWNINLKDQIRFKCIIGKDYPNPIIDLKVSRKRALKAFKSI